MVRRPQPLGSPLGKSVRGMFPLRQCDEHKYFNLARRHVASSLKAYGSVQRCAPRSYVRVMWLDFFWRERVVHVDRHLDFCGFRLYDARMRPVTSFRGNSFITKWSGRPVFYALSTKSQFLFDDTYSIRTPTSDDDVYVTPRGVVAVACFAKSKFMTSSYEADILDTRFNNWIVVGRQRPKVVVPHPYSWHSCAKNLSVSYTMNHALEELKDYLAPDPENAQVLAALESLVTLSEEALQELKRENTAWESLLIIQELLNTPWIRSKSVFAVDNGQALPGTGGMGSRLFEDKQDDTDLMTPANVSKQTRRGADINFDLGRKKPFLFARHSDQEEWLQEYLRKFSRVDSEERLERDVRKDTSIKWRVLSYSHQALRLVCVRSTLQLKPELVKPEMVKRIGDEIIRLACN